MNKSIVVVIVVLGIAVAAGGGYWFGQQRTGAGAGAGNSPAAGGDEARNLAGAPVFVHHEMSIAPGREYDDIVQWVPVSLVVSRLMAAGQLP